MNKNDKLVVVFGVAILVFASIGIYYWVPNQGVAQKINVNKISQIYGELSDIPDAISVSSCSPFYPLIATPLSVHYDSDGNQEVIPLYVKDFEETSNAITRAESMIGRYSNFIIGKEFEKSNKNVSLEIAEKFWDKSKGALIIEDTQEGYNLGVSAVPLASYLSIPVIVTDSFDNKVRTVLDDLGVETTFICGNNIKGYGENQIAFQNVSEIINLTIDIVREKFGDINYITLANPLDIIEANVIDEIKYHFEGTISSSAFTMSHVFNMALGSIRGAPLQDYLEFEVPSDYKYARITINVTNLVEEDIEETGSMIQGMFSNPDGEQLAYVFTTGGLPLRNSDGGIEEDRISWDTIVYDQPGDYRIVVAGKIITKKTADYEIDVRVEKLASSIVPKMESLSSIAPYLTSYHKGILFAKPDFLFVANESIIAQPSEGVVYPASNPDLIEDSNKHTFKIQESLNKILAQLQDNDLKNNDDLQILKKHYEKHPIHIALVGDALMIPHYYYYDTPDANSLRFGWDVASDFIYGNIDPIPRDDKISIHAADKFITKPYSEKFPYQENIVGRITGWDIQDASALIARTFFYDDLLDNMDNDDWKDTATVQTGSGTDFQRVPLIDFVRKNIFRATELPIKWPTGEGHFKKLNMIERVEEGGFDVISTENSYSMRRGLSTGTLNSIKRMGILNMIFFPKIRVQLIAGDNRIKGGENQENSNFIFTFGHGQPMGYSHGDVQTNALGFRPVIFDNIMNRIFFATGIIPALSSGLGNVGGYNVRAVSNMELGPSVMFVESCYIGRIDGFPPKNLISQAYLHAGLNTFVASSRGSPGPGYLDARAKPVGWGIREWIQTQRNPDLQELHFSALFAGDMFYNLGEKDFDVGLSFRNARNSFMEDANSTFFWTPPLSLDIQTYDDLEFFFDNIRPTGDFEDAKVMEKKFTCMLEYNLLGDPAFNPYEPENEGRI